MTNDNTWKGSCFCGDVEFTVSGKPAAMGGSGDLLAE